MGAHRLKILNWNARSINNKIVELFDFMCKFNVDVCCLTETHLEVGFNVTYIHPNYIIHRRDRPQGRGGGVAIIIRSSISHDLLPEIKMDLLECIGVEIMLKNRQKLQLFSIYMPPSTTTLTRAHFIQDLRRITVRFRNGNYYIVGDFNSKHREWNCSRANLAGQLLHDESVLEGFYILFPPTSTHFPDNVNCLPSTIDLTVTNSNHSVTEPYCQHVGSDHEGVVMEIDINHSRQREPKMHYYDHSRADWHAYQSLLNSKFSTVNNLDATEPDSINKIDQMVDRFTNTIVSAREMTIPLICNRPARALQIDEWTESLIRERRMIRRKWQNTRLQNLKIRCNLLTSIIRDRIWTIRNEDWEEQLRPLVNQTRNPLWKLTAKFKKQMNNIPPLINGRGVVETTAVGKCTALAAQFGDNHKNPLGNLMSVGDEEIIDKVTDYLDQPNSDAEIDLPTTDEIRGIIKASKNGKSPGEDGISAALLKRLPPFGFVYLTSIIVACLKQNYFPTIWKNAIVAPVKKPKTDGSIPASYRPISLLSLISKVLERVVLRRIMWHADENNILPENQHGFRIGRSTTTQLMTVTSQLKRNLQTGQTTGVLLLDVEKAFDRIWHQGLIFKLINFGFPRTVVGFVAAFLKARTFQVRVNGKLSAKQNVSFGCPQGAVLSPILYNIYVADAPAPGDCSISFFADDTAIYCMRDKWQETEDLLLEKLTVYHHFFEKWKIRLNVGKTQGLLVTRRTKHEIPQAPLSFNSGEIEWKERGRYLGMDIDRRLTMLSHIEGVISKAITVFRMLYPIIGRRSRVSLTNKLTVYKACIRPVFTYGAPVLTSLASSSNLMKIQRLQNRILKCILNVPWDTSTSYVHYMCDIEYVIDFVNRLSRA